MLSAKKQKEARAAKKLLAKVNEGAKLLSEEKKREILALVTRELMLVARERIKQAEQLLGVQMQINSTVAMSETDARTINLFLAPANTVSLEEQVQEN